MSRVAPINSNAYCVGINSLKLKSVIQLTIKVHIFGKDVIREQKV